MILFLLFVLIWLTVAAAVIAVHFWFLSVPVLCVGGTLAVRRRRRNKDLVRRQPGPCDPLVQHIADVRQPRGCFARAG